MPTYQNGTDHYIYWGRKVLAPNDTLVVSVFIPHVSLGLTKIADTPMVDDHIIFSETFTFTSASSEEISIPESVSGFTVSVIPISGVVTLQCNSATNVAISLDAANSVSYASELNRSTVSSIIITATGAASVLVLVERV